MSTFEGRQMIETRRIDGKGVGPTELSQKIRGAENVGLIMGGHYIETLQLTYLINCLGFRDISQLGTSSVRKQMLSKDKRRQFHQKSSIHSAPGFPHARLSTRLSHAQQLFTSPPSRHRQHSEESQHDCGM